MNAGTGVIASRDSDPLIPEETRADIQGLVTSGFGHLSRAAYLFLAWEEAGAARRWLKKIQPRLSTAVSWRVRAGAPKRKPTFAFNLGVTAEGLRVLGLSESCLETFPREFLEGIAAEARAHALGDQGDNSPSRWQVGRPGMSLHALLSIAAATPEAVQSEVEWACNGEDGVTVLACEVGLTPPDGREHFGFRDGMARVDIRGITHSGVCAGEFILGYENEYGYHPLSPVLRAQDDPRACLPDSPNPHHRGWRDFGRNGTYLVYRKLEQDVSGFWHFLQGESRRLQGRADPSFMVWLAAKMVGRWPGGAPLALAPDVDDPALKDRDDFLYAAQDPRGMGCPFGAHIRRMNPRDQMRPAGPVESGHMSARHRLLRRGRVYGPPLFDLTLLDRAHDPEAREAILGLRPDGIPRGLHFLGINASLKSQFEFIQQSWANNPHFNGVTNNRDPLIGGGGGKGGTGSHGIPRPGLDLRTVPLPQFVTVRGGAYFFLPSLRALGYLAGSGG